MNLICSLAQSDQLIADRFPKTEIPGASFLAINRDGSVLYSSHVGTLSKDSEKPIADDSVSHLPVSSSCHTRNLTSRQLFWTASATKILAAICTVKLVEQGHIGLDDNVLPLLPDLERQQVYVSKTNTSRTSLSNRRA